MTEQCECECGSDATVTRETADFTSRAAGSHGTVALCQECSDRWDPEHLVCWRCR